MAGVHTVAQGDCIFSIAKKYGFHDYKVIYDHPDNADLKKARPNPAVLLPGDGVVIPDPQESKKNSPAPTEELSKFKVKLPRVLVRVKVLDEEEKPVSGKDYELTVGKTVLKGKTDGDGIVEQKVGFGEMQARLVVFLTGDGPKGEQLIWEIGIGHLDPVETIQGVKERLNNMGYSCGDNDESVTLATEIALRTFQKKNDMEPKGQPDDATFAKLKEVHGEK